VIASPLVRLLARLGAAEAPPSAPPFADRLGQWVGWTDAISLSAALEGGMPQSASRASPDHDAPEIREAAECARIRSACGKALAAPVDAASVDFLPQRRHIGTRQHAMEQAVAPLRARLRSKLAAASPAMARLAAVDVVMEQVLAPHESRLLATVPLVLQKHFERLRKSAPGDEPPRWLDGFGRDMREVLMAELDLRFQPIDGLLEALRMR